MPNRERRFVLISAIVFAVVLTAVNAGMLLLKLRLSPWERLSLNLALAMLFAWVAFTFRRPTWAVFLRNFLAYFSSPIGYICITAFVLVSAILAFLVDAFFQNNLANLATLNEYFPLLLAVFVPLITMRTWAEERNMGTEELLLTLPATNFEIVWGKYLAALGIYTVALFFSLSHLVVLMFLGHPDLGLMFSTYLGYWLLGAALIGFGMLGSSLTSSMPVAFLLGLVLCSIFVFVGQATSLFPASAQPWFEGTGAVASFQDLGAGVVSARAVVYFISVLVLSLHLNLIILGRRHWRYRVAWPGLLVAVPVLALGGTFYLMLFKGLWRQPVWIYELTYLGLFGTVFFLLWIALARHHILLRWVLTLAILVSVNVIVGRSRIRVDATAEGIHSLSPETLRILDKLDPERPVYVHAYVSPEVPRDYIQTRITLLALLREYEARGKGKIHLKVHETEKYSPDAREAADKYGIKPQTVLSREEGEEGPRDVFLGAHFSSSGKDTTVPFFFKGLSVEYELTRSIRTVSGQERKIGILSTDAKLFGGFNFQTFQPNPDWEIVAELRKHYEVVEVRPDDAYPEDLDVLIAAMPSSLTQPQMNKLESYLRDAPGAVVPAAAVKKVCTTCSKELASCIPKDGKVTISAAQLEKLCAPCKPSIAKLARTARPVLILEDPFPGFDPSAAPWQQKRSPMGMWGGGGPQEPKGDIQKVLSLLGVALDTARAVWQRYNPHPKWQFLPPEIVFLKDEQRKDAPNPFQAASPISSGLQEMVLLYPGSIRSLKTPGLTFTHLLRSQASAGTRDAHSLMGGGDFAPRGGVATEPYTFAAEIQGQVDEAGRKRPVHAIVIADADLISNMFFQFRREAEKDLNFDNIPFVLNCVDTLAGDPSIVDLRKRRAKFRTLDRIDEERQNQEQQQRNEEKAAEDAAEARGREAQDRFDQKVKEQQDRTDIDETSKEQIVASVRSIEKRRLEVAKAVIEDDKKAAIEKSTTRMHQEIRRIQNGIRLLAVLLPPIPAFLLGLIVFIIRLVRERQSIPKERWVKS